MAARRLLVMNINDSRESSLKGTVMAQYFEIAERKSWRNVQQDAMDGKSVLPDMLLVDIDFRDDPEFKEASSALFQVSDAAGDRLVPVGLVLALPYIHGRAVCSIEIYSGHIASEILRKSPWFLIPYGIIAAKCHGDRYHSSTLGGDGWGQKILEEISTKEEFLQRLSNSDDALKSAIISYNFALERAIKDGRINVNNSVAVSRALDAMARQFENADLVNQAIDPGLYLELWSKSHGVDRIQWRSLCADLLIAGTELVDGRGLRHMKLRLSLFSDTDPVFTKVTSLIKDWEAESREDKLGMLAIERCRNDDMETQREVFRLCVLLANVYALVRVRNNARGFKSVVYKRLGTDGSGNEYRGWFGCRVKERERASVVNVYGVDLPVLDPLSDVVGDDIAGGCFLSQQALRIAERDRERVRRFLAMFEDRDGYWSKQDWQRLPCL